ncbi:peptidoglycan/LPS O-acetylase OafA/YrhL [Pontibacter mucosus]|uniref:Peptidoglycan/LPS O-acetylase OafA/YrhL n=1 Tax=Pontibacter mucosus TaxID=1649266 RepID=A0A2T5Y3D0_9BACT|nr:acyltransferase family protein [Pontibacter mucosus]PTX10675.1 peptidoglycan/LPS O-acetylase OafA/YrhL [Pontibacter mucosus]
MTIESLPKNSFRYDINALRAIAVLGVLFFHYKVPYLEGGFTGVDIFFVISGYLMTRIILGSIGRDEFSYKDYIVKRLNRIVPALLFLVIVLTIVGFFVYLPEDYRLNQRNAAASLLFYSNILYWQSADYFAPSSDTNILLHTWSLSVEWQFYLLYPIALIILKRLLKKQKTFVVFFTGSTLVILIASIIYSNYNPTSSFYLLPTRSWEMLAGGVALFSERVLKSHISRKVTAIVGYLLILVSLLVLDPSMVWPGVYTIIPVLATFLVIVANYSDFRIIRHESVQFIGRISYSLYLWHWPIYVIALYFGVEAGWISGFLLTLISFVLGYVSYTYIESYKFNSITPIIAGMCILFISATALSYYSTNHVLFKRKTLEIASYRSSHQSEIDSLMSTGECFLTSKHTGIKDYKQNVCLNLDKDKKNFLLIGDSHAAHLSASLREHLESNDSRLYLIASSGGFPTLEPFGNSRFKEVMDYAYRDFIPNNADHIDGVILSANWVKAMSSVTTTEKLIKYMAETISYLEKHNISTIIIGQTDVYVIPYPTIVAREHEYDLKLRNSYINKEIYQINEILNREFKSNYASVLESNPASFMHVGDTPFLWDNNHLTKVGADLTVGKILENQIYQSFFNAGFKSIAHKQL